MRRALVVLIALVSTLLVATAAPSYAATYPTLQSGSSGPNVTSLQLLLGSRGFSTTADGAYGSGTQAAVTAFQRSVGLSADGAAGPATFGRLVSTLRQGSTGTAVQALQVQLAKHGAQVATDGDFGPGTDAAVRRFQSANGLGVDGVVGPATWTALLGTGGGSGGGGTPGTTYASLSDAQRANARTIIGVGKGAGIPEYGWVIALATAMQESTLINITYGDRDSVGLFQQRTSQGWGTLAQIQDAVLASKAFYGVATHTGNPGLTDIAGWPSLSVTVAAQRVQRSCCPDAYARWEGLARDVVAHESGAPAIP